MADPTIDDFKTGIPGSISGWDNLEIVSDDTLSQSNQSIVVLCAKLSELIAQYSSEKMAYLMRLILTHMRDYDNPHHDTIENITGGDLAKFYEFFMPGTTPLRPSLVSYRARTEYGQPFSPLIVNRDSEIILVDEQGYLTLYGPNAVGVDWSNGYPIIPCWPAINQMIGLPEFISNPNFTLNNVTSASSYNTGVVPGLYSTQISLFETEGQQEFSVSFNQLNLLAINTQYTFSFFVYPSGYTSGTLYIDVDIAGHAFINLADPSKSLNAGNTFLHTQALPNGWYRVGLSWNATTTTAQMKFGYDPHTYTDIIDAELGITAGYRNYIGTPGKEIFALFGPQLTNSPGLAPFIRGSSLAPTVLSLPGFTKTVSLRSGIFNFKFHKYASYTPSNETMLSIDKTLSITCSQSSLSTAFYIRTNSVNFNTTYDDGFLQSYALSFDQDTVSYLTSTDARVDVSDFQQSPFQPINQITQFSFGPFYGGINAFDQYAVADDNKVLEFLVGVR